MKVLLLYWIFSFIAPNPPYVVCNKRYVQIGESVVINAHNCSGTVTWSTGAVGNTLTVTAEKNISVTATCTVDGQTSLPSAPAMISVTPNVTDCTDNVSVDTQPSGQYNIVNGQNITSSKIINDPGRADFNATHKIDLQPGFEVNSGVVFRAEIEGCQKLKTRTVIEGLYKPWELIWGPDNKIWFTERACRIGVVDPVTGTRTLTYNVPNCSEQGNDNEEGGLLGMVLDPDFLNNHYVYAVNNYYVGNNLRERLFRCVYNETNNTLTNLTVLLGDIPANGWHNGSRLTFGPDGKLYMTTGDAIDAPRAQNLSSLNGKVLRLNPDGSVPSDNPFGSYVWSYGHRNPQGLVWFNNILYSSEHGQNSNDEFNIIEKGRNYGWNNVEGYCGDNSPISGETTYCINNNIKEPIKAFTPTEAPSGIDFYSSSVINQWQNSVLIACLKGEKLIQLKMDETGKQVVYQKNYFHQTFGRLRDVCTAPDGRVFISVDSHNARIIEISKE